MTQDEVATMLCDIYEREWSEQIFLLETICRGSPGDVRSPAVQRWIKINASALSAYVCLPPELRVP